MPLAGAARHVCLGALSDHFINNTVFSTLLGVHDVVSLGVLFDPFELLSGVRHEDLVEPLPHPQDLLGVDVDVCRLPR